MESKLLNVYFESRVKKCNAVNVSSKNFFDAKHRIISQLSSVFLSFRRLHGLKSGFLVFVRALECTWFVSSSALFVVSGFSTSVHRGLGEHFSTLPSF